MMPSCDQTGVPIHFHSSTTSGSAALMSLRILPRVSPRQSPSSTILFEMSSDAGWLWLAPDFFMVSFPEVPDIESLFEHDLIRPSFGRRSGFAKMGNRFHPRIKSGKAFPDHAPVPAVAAPQN